MNGHAAPLNALLRQDLASFIRKSFTTVAPDRAYQLNWHIEAIAWHLKECLRGRIRRLLITLPPRHLKSICASPAVFYACRHAFGNESATSGRSTGHRTNFQ